MNNSYTRFLVRPILGILVSIMIGGCSNSSDSSHQSTVSGSAIQRTLTTPTPSGSVVSSQTATPDSTKPQKTQPLIFLEIRGDIFYSPVWSKQKEDWLLLTEEAVKSGDYSYGFLHTAQNATCILRSPTGNLFQIKENTTVNLGETIPAMDAKADQKTQLAQLSVYHGDVFIHRAEGSRAPLQVKTPSLVLGARGTTFMVSVRLNQSQQLQTYVEVEHGSVESVASLSGLTDLGSLGQTMQNMQQTHPQSPAMDMLKGMIHPTTLIGEKESLLVEPSKMAEWAQAIQQISPSANIDDLVAQLQQKGQPLQKQKSVSNPQRTQHFETLKQLESFSTEKKSPLFIQAGEGATIVLNGKDFAVHQALVWVDPTSQHVELKKGGKVILDKQVIPSDSNLLSIESDTPNRIRSLDNASFNTITTLDTQLGDTLRSAKSPFVDEDIQLRHQEKVRTKKEAQLALPAFPKNPSNLDYSSPIKKDPSKENVTQLDKVPPKITEKDIPEVQNRFKDILSPSPERTPKNNPVVPGTTPAAKPQKDRVEPSQKPVPKPKPVEQPRAPVVEKPSTSSSAANPNSSKAPEKPEVSKPKDAGSVHHIPKGTPSSKDKSPTGSRPSK